MPRRTPFFNVNKMAIFVGFLLVVLAFPFGVDANNQLCTSVPTLESIVTSVTGAYYVSKKVIYLHVQKGITIYALIFRSILHASKPGILRLSSSHQGSRENFLLTRSWQGIMPNAATPHEVNKVPFYPRAKK